MIFLSHENEPFGSLLSIQNLPRSPVPVPVVAESLDPGPTLPQAERWKLEQILKEREKEREYIPKGVPIECVSDRISSIIVDVSSKLHDYEDLELVIDGIKWHFEELMKDRRRKKR